MGVGGRPLLRPGPASGTVVTMATVNDILIDAMERVRESVHQAVDGLDEDQLGYRPDDDANSIGWLVWHLTRVEDDHVAEVADRDQVWTGDGWVDRFGLPFDRAATGYGHGPDEVGQVRPPAALLTGYHDAVHAATVDYLRGLSESDLDRVVDERWDPPVTLAVRLVSVVNDCTQHVGQGAYLRGLLLNR
jgi:uncharacterized damage-inducible protein DinB